MQLTDWFRPGAVPAYFSPRASVRRASSIAARDPRGAFRHFTRAARAGLAEAQFKVGCCYLQGLGVPPSRVEAAFWLEKASRQDHVPAQAALAELYLRGAMEQSRPGVWAGTEGAAPDHARAEPWARAAAKRGSPEGQAVLATILISGPPGMRHKAEAIAWFKRSAKSGCPSGMLGYGLALASSGGDDASRSEAAAYVIKAAEAGLPSALPVAGMIHEDGFGVARDLVAAAHYYRRAAEMGNPQGQVRWALVLLHGNGVAPDPLEGQTWLQRAAAAEDREAELLLAELTALNAGIRSGQFDAADWCAGTRDSARKAAARIVALSYFSGTRGYPRDTQKAARWLRIAHASGDTATLPELANLVLEGHGSQADQAYIYHAFERAAEAGDQVAAFNLAVCLSRGIGTPRDDMRAVSWLREAANDVADAQYWYGQSLVAGRGVTRDAGSGQAWIERAAQGGSAQAKAALTRRGQAHGSLRLADQPSQDAGDPGQADPRGTTMIEDSASARLEPEDNRPMDMEQGPDDDGRCACGSGLAPHHCCQLDVTYAARAGLIGSATSLSAQASQALAAGDMAGAEQFSLGALEEMPRLPEALWVLSQVRAGAGHDPAATVLLNRLVRLDPNHLGATQALALRHFLKGELDAAEPLARNAVRLAPSDPISHNLMAMILTEAQRPQIGEFHYRRVLELSAERDPILLANLAWNLKGQGKIAEARLLYEESAAAAPEVFQTVFGWAQLEEADRQYAAAADLLDRAAAIRADDHAVLAARANLLARQGQDAPALAQFERAGIGVAVEVPGAANPEPNLLLGKGRVLDRLQRYDDAFACFAEGKRRLREATGKSYQEDEARDLAARLQGFFTRGRLAHLPPPAPRLEGPQPMFILGFPRSGTTLMEQVLSSHPRISAGDELPFINDISLAMSRLLGSPLSYPEALSELWMGDGRRELETLRDVYLRKAADRGVFEPGDTWFTDKMPLNEMHLGLISLLFPDSPQIHMLRHPLDVVLSAYSHQLTHGYFCAYDLQSIARHYVLVMDTVRHYLGEMQPRYLAVRYEDLVADLPGQTRRILEFVGEPFDRRCLDFQDNRRLPNTPSYSQVSEKVYDHSAYRHRHYRRHLEPLLPILQPVIDQLGYTAS